jgi:uncharacterized protein YerC
MKKRIVFPDGRTALVEAKNVTLAEGLTMAQIQQVKDLLKNHVSCRLISSHLGISLAEVGRICSRWKQLELPAILQKRATVPPDVPHP